MKATTDMVLTKDRKRIVPLGDSDGDPLAWVASKGEEIPADLIAKLNGTQKATANTKQRKAEADK